MAQQDDDDCTVCDSQCWFPPLELATLVAAGLIPAGVPVLDIGCGAGVEAIFLAKRGWKVYGIDKDETLIARAKKLAKGHRVPPTFHLMDLMWRTQGLPHGWPRSYGVALDRLCVNNVVGEEDEDVSEEEYYAAVASLLREGALYILRDRRDPDEAESTFRRKLFDAGDDFALPERADEFFELLPGGRVLDVRLVGDDTPDWNRMDAMIPIRGRLAILRRKNLRRPRKRR